MPTPMHHPKGHSDAVIELTQPGDMILGAIAFGLLIVLFLISLRYGSSSERRRRFQWERLQSQSCVPSSSNPIEWFQWNVESIEPRGSIGWMHLGVSADGLHLRLDWLASWNNPPVCVPWSEVILGDNTISICWKAKCSSEWSYRVPCSTTFAAIRRAAEKCS